LAQSRERERVADASAVIHVAGRHQLAATGTHVFLVDTGSVGILVPRHALGPDYQSFDPSQDVPFGYVSSGNSYKGQWLKVPVVLGVPADWDRKGDYPTAQVEVFAVDEPSDFNGGMMGIGFAIGGAADGGSSRNPLLQLSYRGTGLGQGYIISTQSIEVGLTAESTAGFPFIPLTRNTSNSDWAQPSASVSLEGDFGPDVFSVDSTILMDTGITEMILWLSADHTPNLPKHARFPPGVNVTVAAPPRDQEATPALQYSFVTGDTDRQMAPAWVEWRLGHGINTGRNVLAGADYLYDAAAGRIGFRRRGTE
jgi:hypothetical protein